MSMLPTYLDEIPMTPPPLIRQYAIYRENTDTESETESESDTES
jgi:hypothetical protein